MNEYRYTTINNDDSATMYIKGIIGKDTDGIIFANEFRSLVKNNIKDIEIRINSGGGSIVSGYDIVDAILDKDKDVIVTTIIAGLAASMAGVIAMTGDVIKMSKMGLFMIHSATGGSTTINDKFNHTLINIFKNRTNITEISLNELMKKETFYTSDEAKDAGFIDEEIEVKERIIENINEYGYEDILNIYQKININLMDNKSEIKDEVIVEETIETKEEVIDETIKEIVNEDESVKDEEEVVEEEESELDILKRQNQELAKRIEELEKEATDKMNKEVSDKEDKVIESAVNDGKISDDIKDTWKNFLSIDFDGGVKALDAIIVNQKGVDVMGLVDSISEVSNKKPVSLRQMEKENSDEVENIYKNNKEYYNQLYFDEYGVYPS